MPALSADSVVAISRGLRRAARRRPRYRRVGDPAVDGGGEIQAEQVAVGEHVIVGQAVQHGVVDRRTEHLAERAGPERRVVVDVAGLRPAVSDHPVGQLVELEQVDADGSLGLQRGQHLGDEPPRGPHLLDFRGRPVLDHPPIVPYGQIGVINRLPGRRFTE